MEWEPPEDPYETGACYRGKLTTKGEFVDVEECEVNLVTLSGFMITADNYEIVMPTCWILEDIHPGCKANRVYMNNEGQVCLLPTSFKLPNYFHLCAPPTWDIRDTLIIRDEGDRAVGLIKPPLDFGSKYDVEAALRAATKACEVYR
jgi:hypothetical protein